MESNQIMVKMVLDRWYSLLKVFDTILDSVSDEKLQKEVSPGKNLGFICLVTLSLFMTI